jgi:putative ABC transport system permease protein
MGRAPEIKQAFRESPNVLQVSTNGYIPTNMNWHQSVWWKGQQEDERTSMWIMSVDRDFMKTLQIKVVEGKEMINEFKFTDRLAYVLNGSALEQIGWDNALGKEFSIIGNEQIGTIVGVVRDFNFRSLHHSIAPCVLLIRDSGQQISVRIRGDQIPETLDYLERKWKEFSKDLPFDYYFLDEEFDKLYKSEMKASRVIGFFTILSLFVACLGLFGLAAYMVQQRTKEIGIRKVNGATVIQIVLLLSTDFAKWILVATLIAWPVAYFTVRSWLQGFEYRTNINFLIFLSAGAIVLIIALVTVCLQTFRAATINPVETLRYE